MSDSKLTYPVAASTDTGKKQSVEIDQETAAAIRRGLRDADEGRVVSEQEARRRVAVWNTKYSSQKRP